MKSTRIPRVIQALRSLALVLSLGPVATWALACQPLTPIEAAEVQAPYVGQIVQAYTCQDREGSHLFMATSVPLLATNPAAGAAEVHFYKYTGNTKRWEARDFVPGAGAGIRIQKFEMLDLDRDGNSEAYISYQLNSATANPDEGKLLVFFKDRKHAIRGAIARLPDDYASRNMDIAFAALPSSVRDHALGMWDNLSLPPQTNLRAR